MDFTQAPNICVLLKTKGDLVVEYVGEIIAKEEMHTRLKHQNEEGKSFSQTLSASSLYCILVCWMCLLLFHFAFLFYY